MFTNEFHAGAGVLHSVKKNRDICMDWRRFSELTKARSPAKEGLVSGCQDVKETAYVDDLVKIFVAMILALRRQQ